jgi:hypothetical protein
MRYGRSIFVLLVLALIYLGAYAFLVRTASVISNPRTGAFYAHPGYGGCPSFVFAPVHAIDRHLIRPQHWASSTPVGPVVAR